MRQPVSRQLKKHLRAVTNENDYFDDLNQRKYYLDAFKSAIDSPFGEVLVRALKGIEKSAMERLVHSWRQKTVMQAKAEIAVSRYLLAMFEGMLADHETCKAELERYRKFIEGEEE